MSKSFYDADFKLGVLGGGQLGRMLIQEAININLSVHVLDPDAQAPCKEMASSFTHGDFNDYDTVMAFGKDKDLITIEIENVNVDALEDLEASGIPVYPQPRTLRIIKDKGKQKQFYQAHDIPTSPFHLIENKADIAAFTDQFPFMQKMRVGGYDGKGVTPLINEASLTNAFDAPSILETFVDFQSEISVIVARNSKGEVSAFPTVEMEFNKTANLVEFLFSPGNTSPDIEAKAQQVAKKVAEDLEIIGLLAVELFVTKAGDVLVNEVAPRPHNSGHQSIEGNFTSQYAQHLRAILNLPLGDTQVVMPSVMVNLLGAPEHTGPAQYEGLEEVLEMPGVYLHLYGKAITKPFRKMGHATIVARDMKTAKKRARQVQETLKIISK